jgi:DNA-directed RNA polymerase subunit RPC12/RpoP
LGAVPTTAEELEKYLLVKYRCERCGEEFLVEEAKGSSYVESVEKCVHCGSKKLEKTSRPDDLECPREV